MCTHGEKRINLSMLVAYGWGKFSSRCPSQLSEISMYQRVAAAPAVSSCSSVARFAVSMPSVKRQRSRRLSALCFLIRLIASRSRAGLQKGDQSRFVDEAEVLAQQSMCFQTLTEECPACEILLF